MSADVPVEGYASVFWAPDHGDDVVAQGAFAESLALRPSPSVAMLHQHDPKAVIGVWDEVVEDAKGLLVRGRITPSTPIARMCAALVKAGALDGLSIGFRTRRARSDPERKLRVLTEIDLWEVSLVTFPLLRAARLSRRPSWPLENLMKETKAAVASAETRAAMHEVMAAFESFRAANDERMERLEKKGADPLMEEKVDRIETALAAAESRMARAAAAGRRPALGGAVAEVADEQKAAFDGYLRTGVAAGLELKGLSEGANTAGGYTVTPDLERLIDRRLMQSSPMRNIATVRTIGSGVFAKPVSTAGVVASWAAETAARTETTAPVLDLLSFPAADLYAAPAATQNLLDDSQVNLDQWLADEVNDAFAAQETQAFVSGDGSGKPKGFLSYTQVADASQAWGQIGYIGSGVSGGFPTTASADKLLDLIYAPMARFRSNGRFVMNRRTLAAVRKFKDSNGDYVLQPGTAPGQSPSIFGYPVTELETMPDIAAGATPIAFGDFAAGYLIVDRAGVRVLRDPYSAKPYVLFYTLKRVGGGVQNFDAIKLLKLS